MIEESKERKAIIPDRLRCPITHMIYLEPVKLLLAPDAAGNPIDGGAIVEKSIVKRLKICPLTRTKITGTVRMHIVEELVAEHLKAYPDDASEQYQKPIAKPLGVIRHPPYSSTYTRIQQTLTVIQEQSLEQQAFNQDIEAQIEETTTNGRHPLNNRSVCEEGMSLVGSTILVGVCYALSCSLTSFIGAEFLKTTGHHGYNNSHKIAIASLAGGGLSSFTLQMLFSLSHFFTIKDSFRNHERRKNWLQSRTSIFMSTQLYMLFILPFFAGRLGDMMLLERNDLTLEQHAATLGVGLGLTAGLSFLPVIKMIQHVDQTLNEESCALMDTSIQRRPRGIGM